MAGRGSIRLGAQKGQDYKEGNAPKGEIDIKTPSPRGMVSQCTAQPGLPLALGSFSEYMGEVVVLTVALIP